MAELELGSGIKIKHIHLNHGYEFINEFDGVEDDIITYYAKTFSSEYIEFAMIDRKRKIIYLRDDLSGLSEKTAFKHSKEELLTRYIDYRIKSYNINKEELV